ncbi:uncharacterized protein DS421_13g403960 [Arachis hypogaea]|nr:uncharacterized protein DS421_13g403960 [Arachis hypogaea]
MDLLNFLLHSLAATAAILKLLPVTLSLLVQLYFSCSGVPWSSLLMLVFFARRRGRTPYSSLCFVAAMTSSLMLRSAPPLFACL